jgi:nicotinate phosphoribosyltransferase
MYLQTTNMNLTHKIYGTSLSLLTDLYQITMAYGYWKTGMLENEAVFNLYFRKSPFQGGYAIASGLEYAISYLQDFRFTQDDVDYLATLTGNDGKVLFEQAFLDYLKNMRFSCDIDAIPEGTVVFPNEPLIRVRGPLIQGQLIETPLLNLINFQTLIATKSSRINRAANGSPVLEFGLRRAQGIDGGLAASRAAYIGGCEATSNVLAGKIFGIPVKGTHAHSWVMSFANEVEAFEKYSEAMPNNAVFLVDTYDTIQGVKYAIEAGKKLKEKGYKMVGIRLDSGDLAYLSIQARKLLDEAGFHDANIVASNDLDEYIITSLNQQEAKIDVWGIGTKLVTAFDQPALGGVYKVAAVKKEDGTWDYKVKLSEQAIKVSNPGVLQVKRFFTDEGQCIADMIFDEENPPKDDFVIVDPLDNTRRKIITKDTKAVDLLKPIFKNGNLVYTIPDIHQIKQTAKTNVNSLHNSILRLTNPHEYPVGLERNLYDLKTKLILTLRGTK